MLRAFKIEIDPTQDQIIKIHQTIGVCRFIYNFYLGHNKEVYEAEKRFISGMDFSKWLNNEFIPNNQNYGWIKDVSSKAVKQAIMNGEKAYKRFFEGESKFPNFKKKKNQNTKAYFPKNNKTDWTVERHRIKIPTFGFVRLKEKGYIPAKANVTSGTVSFKAGRYYVSVLVNEEGRNYDHLPYIEGIGVDLGLKDFAIVSNGIIKSNVNKTVRVKKLEKRLKREQKRLSRKYENKKKRGEKSAIKSANIDKQVLKIQKLHQTLGNIRSNYVNQTVRELVKTKPEFITIEDLNISGMMKNRHLSKAVAQQNFHNFRVKLTVKCKYMEIELRVVSRFYPSSKKCSCCGNIKKDLKLSNRVYICEECSLKIDRDFNATINLRDAEVYTIAS